MTFNARSKVNRGGSRGFTIVELLVASGVTMIIALIMVALITNILSSWGRLSGNLSTGSQARLVLEVMAEDLQSSMYEGGGSVWLAASIMHGSEATENDRGWVEAGNPRTRKPVENDADYLRLLPEWGDGTVAGDVNDPPEGFDARRMPWRYGVGGTWLRFFTTAPDPAGSQVPRAVSYQIIRRPVSAADDAEVRYILYRSTVSAGNTIGHGYHLGEWSEDEPYDIYPEDSPYYASSTQASPEGDPSPGDAETIRRPPPSAMIANDVIDFGVRLYTRNPNTGELDLEFPQANNPDPSGSGRASQEDRHYYAGEILPNDAVEPFPDVVDIFIRILTPEGVRLIQNHEALPGGVEPAQEWWEIAEEHSQVYVRRVHLRR